MVPSSRISPADAPPRGSSSPGSEGLRAIALAGDDAPGLPGGVLVGFDAPSLNDNDELAFVASVRRGRDTLDVLYFWNGQRLQRVAAEGDRLLRIGGTMDKIGGPALNNAGVIAFPATLFRARPSAASSSLVPANCACWSEPASGCRAAA